MLPAEGATVESGVFATPIPESTPTNEEWYALRGDGGYDDYHFSLEDQLDVASNLDEKITILDAEINAPYMEYPLSLQFWKAEILRDAGRNHKALAEYVAIYEAAPESAWGMLAALHIEPMK